MCGWSKKHHRKEDHFARGSCVPRLRGGVRANKERGEASDGNTEGRARPYRPWTGVRLRRIKGLLSTARGARQTMFFGHSGKRPHPSRVQPPPLLPTLMDEPDGVFRSKQPACVVGGRASGGRGSRPFPRSLQGATVTGLQHRNNDNNSSSSSSSNADGRRPAAVATDAAAAADTAGKKNGLGAVAKPSRRAQRGVPLVQWVWPANSGIARVGSEWFRGAAAAASSKQVSQENPVRVQGKMQGRTRKSSSVVVGTVCEPVRPTRLDLSSSQGYPTSSRVIYTAKGGHTNPADAVAPSGTTAAAAASRNARDGTDTTPDNASTRPPALNLPLHHPHEAPWLDSSPGRGFGGGGSGSGGFGSGGARSRAYSANSAAAAGLQSPRYLQSTTVSQAKAVEPSGKSRALESRPSRRVGSARRGGNGGRGRSRSRSRGRGSADEGGSDDGGFGGGGNGGGFGGPGGMLESLGGFLGIGKGGDGAGAGRSKSRGGAGNTASRTSGGGSGGGGGKMGSKVFRRLRKSTETKHSRYGSVKIKAPSSSMGGGGRAPAADNSVQQQHHHHRAVLRRDEREIVTMHTPGVLRPEGVRLRVVKASGRTLEDTKFHMEIRTQRPGQVWSVCRRHKEFQSLHSCLQGRFPALVLPRLPRPPPTGGGIVLEPATLERARAGLQGYIAAVVAKVPAAWGLEEFVMFLDSEEKGRRLFSRRKRKKETRRVLALPCPASCPETEGDGEEEEHKEEEEEEEEEGEEEEESKPAARTAKFAPDLVSPRVTSVVDGGSSQKSLLDLKVEEKKQALKALEGEAANHFDGVGAVMNTAVSFSSDDDDGDSDLDFEEGNDFIDGEDAIRAMLDRDADEAEDDNLFSIPAGTDFGIPFDDDDDDDDGDDDDDDIGGSFDITYRG